MIATDFPPQRGGVATYSFELMEFLRKSRFSCHFVIPQKSLKSFPHSQVTGVKLSKGGLLSVPSLVRELLKIIKNEKPDYIINTLWLPGGFATFIALKILRKKIPYSITVHGMEILESKHSFKHRLRTKFAFLKNKTLINAHRLICVSQYSKKILETKVILNNLNSAYVVHNGVNPTRFKLDLKMIPPKTYPRLLTLCRLQTHKGIDSVLTALPKIIAQFPDLKYTIAGDGPDRDRLEKLVDELKLRDFVEFIGALEEDQISKLYSEQDLFILLSREHKHWVEGFGLVFLEAALFKLPSLGGNSGGIPEAILEGQTGWLVDPLHPEKIAAKLKELLSDPVLLKKVGEKAYLETLNHRTWDHSFTKMIQILGLS